MGAVRDVQESGLGRHVGECAVAVVTQQRIANRPFPPAAHHEQIEVSVVVVVGLDQVDASQLVAEPGRARLGELSVRLLEEQVERLAGIDAGQGDVGPPVAVEVVHDGAAGATFTAEAEGRRNFGEGAGIFGGLKSRRRQERRGRHAVGIPSERHRDDVHEPAQLEVAWPGRECLGERRHGMPRPRRHLVAPQPRNREDAPHGVWMHHAIFDLAAPQFGNADERIKRRCRARPPRSTRGRCHEGALLLQHGCRVGHPAGIRVHLGEGAQGGRVSVRISLAGRLPLDLADAVLVELDGVTFRGLSFGAEALKVLRVVGTHERKDFDSSRELADPAGMSPRYRQGPSRRRLAEASGPRRPQRGPKPRRRRARRNGERWDVAPATWPSIPRARGRCPSRFSAAALRGCASRHPCRRPLARTR